jgi:DNA polymerase V
MDYSNKIYEIYLKWFSKDDMFVYSIDEVFIDITKYLGTYKLSPRELATKVVTDVFNTTGITATCGIGSNLYLCKIAMDIMAKHAEPDENGVRIAGLDEMAYRKYLWNHKPLTDFWRVGKGTAERLSKYNIFTMGDIARASIKNEDMLYKIFGINAELIIDHAWGYENSTIDSVKSYKPVTNSLSEGQVLSRPYKFEEAKLIVKEMAESLSFRLVRRDLITSKIVLDIVYDHSNLYHTSANTRYTGEADIDHYGRKIPKHSHGTTNLSHKTSSTQIFVSSVAELFEQIANKDLYVRRINITAQDVVNEDDFRNILSFEQLNMFIDYKKLEDDRKRERSEKSLQKTVLNLKDKFGKNSVLKGMNFIEYGTAIARNGQIGGHRS